MDLIGPILPPKARPYAKAYLALALVIVSVLADAYTDIAPLQLAVKLLTALGVYLQPNLSSGEGDEDEPA